MARGKKAKRRDELLDHPRLKSNEISSYRAYLLEQQDYECPLCGARIDPEKAALDHCHSRGNVRAALHRGCNSILGKVENNYKRVGVSIEQLRSISPAIAEFLAVDYSGNPYHPDHRTEEEKRLSRNERAKERRVKKNPARRMKPRNT